MAMAQFQRFLPGIRAFFKTNRNGAFPPASAAEPAFDPASSRHGYNDDAYAKKIEAEKEIYKDVEDINVLPEIFHYWSHNYLRPMFEEFGLTSSDQFFAKYFVMSATRCGDESPVFLSVGVGNCDAEVRIAKIMREMGLTRFVIRCLDINPHMLKRGREMAEREGVLEHLEFVEGDFNRWVADGQYTGIMANQSLHHVLNLEGLFDQVKLALKDKGYFAVHDIIGRNGHQRWPEAMVAVQEFWKELPQSYRYNQLLRRHEEEYENWDCSDEGFEGIRAQDVLPLLLERFDFELFIGFANVVDVFIDRTFGHNFDANGDWDKAFVDRLHFFDEEGFRAGTLKPTHMVAAMTKEACEERHYSRGISPRQSVRLPD